MKTIASTIAALTLAAGMTSGTAQAFDAHVIDELAYSLMRQSAAAAREVRYGLRNAPQYEHLYHDVYEMYQSSDHIHDVAHVAGSRKHIRKDARRLDELVHHVQELIDEMSVQGHSRRRGRYGHGRYGHGAANRYHLRRLSRMVDGIAETVHELQDAVGMRRGKGRILEEVPVIDSPPGPVFPDTRSGLRIDPRRGRFSLSLRIP